MVICENEAILRENERLLRRCGSVAAGLKLVPSLITGPDCETWSLLRIREMGSKPVFRLSKLGPRVYYLPGFLGAEECLTLSREILNQMIDNPPHANNFGDQSPETKSMWREYQDKSSENPSLRKLRWSCVGCHYNWGERTYDTKLVSNFPSSFAELYSSVLEYVNTCDPSSNPLKGDPQSAIVNFYHSHRISDRLGGHRDDVESDDTTPLVSISMGLSGFFLIENEALVLRSGDVLIMADDARQSLHGVPSIIGPDRRELRRSSEPGDSELEAVESFLRETRISISMRQVY